VVYVFVEPEEFARVEPAYLARLKEEVAEIAAAIPHDELAIQWELVAEMILAEGLLPPGLAMDRAGMVDRVVALADSVPADIETGYHLCYGDFQHKHWKDPEDSAVMVDLANTLVARAHRPIQWMHLPIPKSWTEPRQFAGLQDLTPPRSTWAWCIIPTAWPARSDGSPWRKRPCRRSGWRPNAALAAGPPKPYSRY
jgi:hypothetical protein